MLCLYVCGLNFVLVVEKKKSHSGLCKVFKFLDSVFFFSAASCQSMTEPRGLPHFRFNSFLTITLIAPPRLHMGLASTHPAGSL